MNIYTILVIMACLIYSSMANMTMETRSKETYVYNIFYWDVPPLIKSNKNNGVFGIVPDILRDIESRCIGYSNENVTAFVNYTRMPSEKEMVRIMSNRTQTELKGTVWGPFLTDHLNNAEFTKFCAENNIIPKKLVGIEDMAVVVRQERLFVVDKLVSSLLRLLHLYCLFLMSCVIAGLLFWLVDISTQPDVSFMEGIIAGIWWAFITMTTVGYGDVTPKTKLGRVFTVIWMYYGMVVFCIVTGIITTLVFGKDLFDISDKDVAVLEHSYEEHIGINTFNINPVYFDTYDQVLDAVRNDDNVFAGLVPGSIAAWRQDEMKEYGLNVVDIHHLSLHAFLLEMKDNAHSIGPNNPLSNQLEKCCHQYPYHYIYNLNVKGNYERLLEPTLYLIHSPKELYNQKYIYVTAIICIAIAILAGSFSYFVKKFHKKRLTRKSHAK